MISKAELERGIRATEAQLSEAMTDPEFRRECAEMDARQKLKERIARFRVKFRIRKKLRLANHGSRKEICIINDRPP